MKRDGNQRAIRLVWSTNSRIISREGKRPRPLRTLSYGESLAEKVRQLAEERPHIAAAIERALDDYLREA
jgi:hypothetical protein